MTDHRSQCPEEPVQCPFEEVGCNQKFVRHELEQHMSATQQQHLLMVMGAYMDMKEANEKIEQHSLMVTEACKEMKKDLNQLKEKLSRTVVELQLTKGMVQLQLSMLDR